MKGRTSPGASKRSAGIGNAHSIMMLPNAATLEMFGRKRNEGLEIESR
jgi:hypothetical protein